MRHSKWFCGKHQLHFRVKATYKYYNYCQILAIFMEKCLKSR